jgi:hypothetical protein
MRDLDGPHWFPGLIGPDGRLTCFCKGGDNGAALAEQKKARKQSADQFAQQMRITEKQMELAASVETPQLKPASPVPSMGLDTKEAGWQARRAARRRFGAGRTVFAGESRATPNLGGAVALAA